MNCLWCTQLWIMSKCRPQHLQCLILCNWEAPLSAVRLWHHRQKSLHHFEATYDIRAPIQSLLLSNVASSKATRAPTTGRSDNAGKLHTTRRIVSTTDKGSKSLAVYHNSQGWQWSTRIEAMWLKFRPPLESKRAQSASMSKSASYTLKSLTSGTSDGSSKPGPQTGDTQTINNAHAPE